MAISKDLVAASATPLVLSILAQGESYGYEIIKRVREISGGKMNWTDGMLYPVLHRLENQGLIHSRWRISENGRRRKYYRIEKKGARILENQKKEWMSVVSTLNKIWEEKPCLN
jgi:DNA-binding PadR family transcriptional regulator